METLKNIGLAHSLALFCLLAQPLTVGCDGSTSKAVCGQADLQIYFADQDGDGLGDDGIQVEACAPPNGFASTGGDPEPDCATNDTDVCGVCGGPGLQVFYADVDGDGRGDPAATLRACEAPQGYVDGGGDLDPTCERDDVDSCGVCGGPGPMIYFADQDGDGFGDESAAIEACERPPGFVRSGGDQQPFCASNDEDDCGVCGGADQDKDCAGVCFGAAFSDGCGVCVGGATGRDASVDDADDDGIPDTCDQCPQDEMARTIIQWTEIAHSSGEGGAYTFQVVLYANGDVAFNYLDVEPFEATLTVGYQTSPGTGASLDVNGPLVREVRSIYYRRTQEGALALAPAEAFVWVDIRHRGEVLRLPDDGVAEIALGFDYPFGDARYARAAVGSDGWVGFVTPWPTSANTPLPNPSAGVFLAPFWDDLDPSRTRGSIRFQAIPHGCPQDCAGVYGGVAEADGCGLCTGGTTGQVPEGSRDCAHICDGGATVDVCGVCSGGMTGIMPLGPEDCRRGPDLVVDQEYLRATVVVDEIQVDDPCLLEERCVRGLGLRRLLRFGTRIANLGNRDLMLGEPSEDLPFWHWDECHSHYHFQAYAAYELHDVATGERLPYGAKSGFSVIDIGVYDAELAPDGCVGYNGRNQGISVGCQDTYGRGLQCQWIDITGLADGTYDLVVITNPAGEIEELDYDNNSARVRFELNGGQIRVLGRELRCADDVDEDGDGLTDCDDPDCEDICGLPPRQPALACPVDDLQSATGIGVVSGAELPVEDAQDGGCAGQGRGEVGYTWTAPSEDTYLIHGMGSTFDASLYVRRGGCDGEVLGCSEDSSGLPGDGTPGVEVALAAEETVTVVVDGMLREDGEFTLNVHGRAAACAGGELGAALGAGVARGTNEENGTVLLAACGRAAAQAVYRWRAPEAGRYEFDTFGSDFDTVLFALDEVCSPEALECNDDTDGVQSRLELDLEEGELVTLVIGGFHGRTGNYALNINRAALAEGPCPDVALEAALGVVHRGGAEARFARSHGTCGGGGREVLVGWTAPMDDTYLIHTLGSSGDPVLYVLEECGGQEVVCNHDFLALGTVSAATIDLSADDSVVIAIDDLPIDDDVQLSIFGRRANCGAQELPVVLGPMAAQGSNQDTETRMVTSCGSMMAQETFHWVAPGAGAYIFDTFGSDFDTGLEVVRGTCGSESLGCNDDTEGLQSQVRVDLEAGDEITVIIGGFKMARGNYVLNARRALDD